jgi:hypothetical protein
MLVVDDLQPTVPVWGVPIDVQAESMRLLRRMRYEPEHPHEFPDQMVAWANSNSLTREDMAAATDLSVEQVNQIIRDTVERDRAMKTNALLKAAARHLPSGRRG